MVLQYQANADLQSLGDLYQRYMELVYGVCLQYLKDPEDAKDAVLNIYEELTVKLKKYEVHHFKAWLYQLSKNHCLMKLRSDKKFSKAGTDVAVMQNDDPLHLDAVMEKEIHLNAMHACIEQLVAEQKRAVTMFYLDGKCYNEISAATGMEWKMVRSFIQNGRRNLKICMDKQLADS